MASEVYTTEIITLQDETEVEIRPLPIIKLRKFTRMWSDHLKEIADKFKQEEEKPEEERDLAQAELSDLQYDTFIKMCALGLDSLKKENQTEKKFLDYLETVLDEPTIRKILLVTGNLKLNDPNQMPPTTAA